MSTNKGGRPKKWTDKALIKLGEDLINWLNESKKNVLFQEFLNDRGLYKSIVYEYTTPNTKNGVKKRNSYCKKFHELINQAKSIQETKIWKYGLANKFNPTMSIFLLKNQHGYTDKMEKTNKGELEINHGVTESTTAVTNTLAKIADKLANSGKETP